MSSNGAQCSNLPYCFFQSQVSHFVFAVLGLELRAHTLSHSTSPFLWWVFQDRVSWTICLGRLRTRILLISASWVARITGWATGTWLSSLLKQDAAKAHVLHLAVIPLLSFNPQESLHWFVPWHWLWEENRGSWLIKYPTFWTFDKGIPAPPQSSILPPQAILKARQWPWRATRSHYKTVENEHEDTWNSVRPPTSTENINDSPFQATSAIQSSGGPTVQG
jgi:hypothetical protein